MYITVYNLLNNGLIMLMLCGFLFLIIIIFRVRFLAHNETFSVPRWSQHGNPLKCSGIRWLHFEVFSAIQV